MLYASVDPRDNSAASGCATCCCDTISMRPGETNLMVINYAPWAIPFARKGLACNTQFDLQQMQTCPQPTGDNLPPTQSGPISFDVPFAPFGTPPPAFTGDLTDFVTDPEAGALTFEVLPFYGTSKGKITVNADGTFSYAPPAGYNGLDRFYFTASDGVNDPVIMEAVFRIGNAPPATYTPVVGIGKASVNSDDFTLSFPISVSPAAKTCETYRVNVRQGALDCDCECYWHMSCFDIQIKKC